MKVEKMVVKEQKRSVAGRKKGSGKFGEETKVIRVPVSAAENIKQMLLAFPKKLKPEPGRTKVEVIYWPSLNPESVPATVFTSRVAAGMPSLAEDYVEGVLDLNKHILCNPETTFFVRVSGDSMIEAGIHTGDLLVVDRSLRPQSGKVVIAVINGELTVKRLFKENDKLFLMPENPSYPSIEITDAMDFMIWGVVTNVVHPL
jgi:DNA polymerase V